jgi:hypothetical protein
MSEVIGLVQKYQELFMRLSAIIVVSRSETSLERHLPSNCTIWRNPYRHLLLSGVVTILLHIGLLLPDTRQAPVMAISASSTN